LSCVAAAKSKGWPLKSVYAIDGIAIGVGTATPRKPAALPPLPELHASASSTASREHRKDIKRIRDP
jgi:hypothetical protein